MKIEARLAALEHLVIAAVAAIDARAPGMAAATARIAQRTRPLAGPNAEAAATEHVSALLDHLRDICGLPVNDR